MHGLGGVIGLAFLGLTVYTLSLPVLRGSVWSVKDAAVRASTIVSGVLFLLFTMAALLPWVLDRLEGRTFVPFVSARHVRSTKSGFLTIISVLSICGVAISSCALCNVVSVMGGFSHDLKRRILGHSAHIVVNQESADAFGEYETALRALDGVPGVVGAMAVAQGEVMVSSPSNLAGAVIRGIDPERLPKVTELSQNIELGRLSYLMETDRLRKLPPEEIIGFGAGGEKLTKGPDSITFSDDIDPLVRSVTFDRPERPGLIIGREMAKTLHVYVGDEVTLVSPLGDLGPMGILPKTKKMRIAAIFFSGMYEYDATHAYALMGEVQTYFGTGDRVTSLEVKVDNSDNVDRYTDPVRAALARPELQVRDWREVNKNLFASLKLERFVTFIILSLAILVASFCIVCTLLLMVSEKGKEIAILKAIGTSDETIMKLFVAEGLLIGTIGMVFGVLTGLALATGLKWFGFRLDPDVYYVDQLPINVDPLEFLAVAVAAVVICALATIYPARAASRLRPVEGLRNE